MEPATDLTWTYEDAELAERVDFFERDTIPCPPPPEVLAAASCCLGAFASEGKLHSEDCPETTAVECVRELRKPSPYPRKRSSTSMKAVR